MADMDKISRDDAEQAAKKLPKFPNNPPGEHVRRPEGPPADDGPPGTAPHEGQQGGVLPPRSRSTAAGSLLEDHVRPEGDGRRRAGRDQRYARRASRDKELHVGVGQCRARHRRGPRHLRRPGLPPVTAQLGGGRRPGGLDVQGVCGRRRPQGRVLAAGTSSTGTPPYELPDGNFVENQGDSDYGSAVSLLKRHRGLRQHGVHRHDPGHGRRPGEDHQDGQRHGRTAVEGTRGAAPDSPTRRPGSCPTPAWHWVRRRSARSTWRTATRRSPTAAWRWRPTSSRSVGRRRRRGPSTKHKSAEGERAVSEDIAADTSYALATGGRGRQTATRRRSSTAPPQARPGTATKDGGAVSVLMVRRLHATARDRQSMYVRGTGNGQLDGWLP